ncbi:MAG TPA: aminotransferase class I/II-fold pyridoxal phosphate-dependent enzyme [Acidiphilium sp.]|nr:MAG: 8-amino-7-oxononanoate synthase [Acidiphilium sp. 21-60-14]OYV90790.1 MAG: 8-amino-7-oxononanoate synthase [Acidiphilium sp. 37-60-79]OZB38661.1 MAG: 8-amino-7-oxononanoate synthase [Acidiphilium sp. 34-60-192]HQT87328.1 aminotransferase class I/II-fold pyridoxal phosphate-dependent enzyme [Acidiphilium sp.]HQU24908.1 aminotransferase class I/II-fold pyridoxal phosphate-dependent enzyme [Acidiphilium sp.]
MSQSLDDFASSKLAGLERSALRRRLVTTARSAGAQVARGGASLISFSCNDYLNLSTDPAVIEAAVAATRRYGAGAGSSRLVTGDHPLYRALEQKLAALKGTEDCMVFGSGYLANSGIMPALMGAGDVIFVDEWAHACIHAGAKLSGAQVVRFAHNDVGQLAALLERERGKAGRALIATDTVFSMDGDCAPLEALAALAARHDAWLLADDAHGLGVVERKVRGVALQMGTLSKSVGAYGGYLCASAVVCELLRNRARSFVYTTGLPPGVIGAAIAGVERIATDADYCARPLQHARMFTTAVGLPAPESAIVPVILGAADRALAAQALLEQAGFLVAAIRPPTVPEGTARLRFTFTAQHEVADIQRLADLVRREILPRGVLT